MPAAAVTDVLRRARDLIAEGDAAARASAEAEAEARAAKLGFTVGVDGTYPDEIPF